MKKELTKCEEVEPKTMAGRFSSLSFCSLFASSLVSGLLFSLFLFYVLLAALFLPFRLYLLLPPGILLCVFSFLFLFVCFSLNWFIFYFPLPLYFLLLDFLLFCASVLLFRVSVPRLPLFIPVLSFLFFPCSFFPWFFQFCVLCNFISVVWDFWFLSVLSVCLYSPVSVCAFTSLLLLFLPLFFHGLSLAFIRPENAMRL